MDFHGESWNEHLRQADIISEVQRLHKRVIIPPPLILCCTTRREVSSYTKQSSLKFNWKLNQLCKQMLSFSCTHEVTKLTFFFCTENQDNWGQEAEIWLNALSKSSVCTSIWQHQTVRKYLYHKSVAVSSLTQKEKFEATASQRVTQSCHFYFICSPSPSRTPFSTRHRAGDSLFWELANQKHL